jgi:hypothetical protein
MTHLSAIEALHLAFLLVATSACVHQSRFGGTLFFGLTVSMISALMESQAVVGAVRVPWFGLPVVQKVMYLNLLTGIPLQQHDDVLVPA